MSLKRKFGMQQSFLNSNSFASLKMQKVFMILYDRIVNFFTNAPNIIIIPIFERDLVVFQLKFVTLYN